MRAADVGGEMVILGRVSAVYGVRGWVKLVSETEPREGILGYSPWYLGGPAGWRPLRPVEGRSHGKGLIARLEGCAGWDQAAVLVGSEIAVRREQLPILGPDDYYWSDLEGLRVGNREGRDLGRVSRLFATGANDVLVVTGERERLIPYLWGQVVLRVDLATASMVVDWDADF
jgi:16S rRNA processing protein RimM